MFETLLVNCDVMYNRQTLDQDENESVTYDVAIQANALNNPVTPYIVESISVLLLCIILGGSSSLFDIDEV